MPARLKAGADLPMQETGVPSLMFKFALAAGICAEWLSGPTAGSLAALMSAGVRVLMVALAAWLALETMRVLWRAVLTLDRHG